MKTTSATLASLLILISVCSALDISPPNPNPGDTVTITGQAQPNQEVSLRSSFHMDLPIIGGGYNYETAINVPQKPNRFTFTAKNVEDLNVGLRLGMWITKRFEATGGTIRMSQSNIRPGKYTIKLFGQALPGVSRVPIEVQAETTVKADDIGRYSLDIDTSGVPSGEFRIDGLNESKLIWLGSTRDRAGSETKNYSSTESVSTKLSSVPITPEVMRWYANELGLDADNATQYAEAGSQLNKSIANDQWRVITRGSPLTEKAGDCQDDYCLVRGAGACRTCREKEMVTYRESPNKVNQTDLTLSLEINQTSDSRPEGKSLMDILTDKILSALGKGGA